MGFYGYCVVPRSHPVPAGLVGIGRCPVSSREVAGMAVWHSDIERPEPGVEAIKAHNQVVEAAVTDAVTPVPLRFGQWAAETEPFDRVISEKANWYEERLAKFAGGLEFGIRVASPERQAPARDVRAIPAESGVEYMRRLQDRAKATAAAQGESVRIRERITEVMRAVVREELFEDARTPHGIVTVAHLVSREDFDEYHERASTLRDAFPELRFLVSGPWVPYSFAA